MNARTSPAIANPKPLLLFGLSVLLGALIWILSLPVTGHREPWDAGPLYYPFALFAAGFIPACFEARRFWLWAIGAWLGQAMGFAVFVLREPGGLWPLGFLFLCVYALLGLVGAAIGAGVHCLIHRTGS